MKHDQKKMFVKQRNVTRLLQDRGELNLSTRSESTGKKRFSRKEKHNKLSDCWIEFFKRIESSDTLELTTDLLKSLFLQQEVSTPQPQ